MADATQVQIRRDTAANLAVTTPVEAELGYDQTNKRILIGDGSTAGGIPHVNYLDARNAVFNRGSIGGTANAITLTLSPVATSYQTGMEISFIATGTNTGATTIDIDGLGTRNIQKIQGGALQSLEAADIISGCIYTIVYNGSSFQIMGTGSIGAASISQGDLNTSTGTFSENSWTAVVASVFYIGNNSITAPGGQYGFSLQTTDDTNASYAGWVYSNSSSTFTTRYSAIAKHTGTVTGNSRGQQRYINSSPPFDLGDGEVGGFIFALVSPSGEIVSHYAADVPPWGYNGRTDIRCTHKCPITGKKFNMVSQNLTYEQIMDGVKPKLKPREITHAIKNADMDLIPHPFGVVPAGHHVVLLDPMDDKIRRTIEYQNQGGVDWTDALFNGKIEIGDDCKRCGPKGVHIHKMKYKYTKKF